MVSIGFFSAHSFRSVVAHKCILLIFFSVYCVHVCPYDLARVTFEPIRLFFRIFFVVVICLITYTRRVQLEHLVRPVFCNYRCIQLSCPIFVIENKKTWQHCNNRSCFTPRRQYSRTNRPPLTRAMQRINNQSSSGGS